MSQSARFFDPLVWEVPRFVPPVQNEGGGAPAYTLPTPFIIHGFDGAEGWFPTNAGPISVSSNGASVTFTDTSAGSSGTATNNNVGTFGDPAGWGVLALLTDLGSDPAGQITGACGVRIGSGGSGGFGGTYSSSAAIGEQLGGGARPQDIGDYWSAGNVAAMSGLPGAGVIGLRTEPSVAPGGRTEFKQKLLLGNAAGRPTVLLTFDDGLATQATTALAMMNYYGLKGTAYIPWANIGVVGGRMNVAGVQTLRDAGWAVCLDGTEDDNVMTGLANPAAVVAKLQEGRTWLQTNGFPAAGGEHFCYPNGDFGVNPSPVQITGASGSLGSAVLTMASTTGLSANMRVVGVGIPNSPVTRVATVDSGTQITLTANLTVAMSSGRFKALDDSSAFYTRKMQDALAAAGFKTGRTTIPGDFYSRFGVGNRGLVLPGNTTTDATFNMIKGYVDTVLSRGTTTMIYLHGVLGSFNPVDGTDDGTGSAGLSVGVAVLNDALAYIKEKVVANQLSVLTVPEWWARDGANPVMPPGAN